jgi:hypothetical protein
MTELMIMIVRSTVTFCCMKAHDSSIIAKWHNPSKGSLPAQPATIDVCAQLSNLAKLGGLLPPLALWSKMPRRESALFIESRRADSRPREQVGGQSVNRQDLVF